VGIFTGMAAVFIDLPSVLLVLVPLFFFLFTSKSGKVLGRYIKTSFKKESSYIGTELKTLSVALKHAIKFTAALGGFGFLAGGIAALGYLGAKESLGPILALSLITLTYSVMIICFVFIPVQAWADIKITALENEA
jgi:flagellar motor component MotA